MSSTLVSFLGRPRTQDDSDSDVPTGEYQTVRYEFPDGSIAEPTSVMGVALYRYLQEKRDDLEHLVFVGTSGSNWDVLEQFPEVDFESPSRETFFLELMESADDRDREVTPDQLERLESILETELDVEQVSCVLVPFVGDRDSQLQLLNELGTRVKTSSNSQVYLDVTHGPRHFGFVGLESALFFQQTSDWDIGGIYYGDINSPTKRDEASGKAVELPSVEELAEWAHAVRTFRKSGRVGRLPELLEDRYPGVATPLRHLRFTLNANRHERVEHAIHQARSSLSQCESNPPFSFFHEGLRAELDDMLGDHLADLQLELARRAQDSGDTMRAVTCAHEAIISALSPSNVDHNIDDNQKGYVRNKVNTNFLSDALDDNLTPSLDLFKSEEHRDTLQQLKYLRNTILHGIPPQDSSTSDFLESADKLDDFLDRALPVVERHVSAWKTRNDVHERVSNELSY